MAAFGETLEVNVVNVEVYVLDRQGRPVTDLDISDFEIFEDGRPVAITNYFAVSGGEPVTANAPAAEATPPRSPSLDLAVGGGATPEDQRLRLVVYIDNVNLRPNERRRVMRELRQFVGQNVSSEDRAMVLSYDRSLKVRQPFTSDLPRLTEALREVDTLRGEGTLRDAERHRLINSIDEAESAGQAMSMLTPYADSIFDDINRTIDALNQAVDSLAGLPGRKALLYVSSGVPMVAAMDLFTAVEQKFPGTGAHSQLLNYDAARRFEELAARANAHGVTFYTLDAGGLRLSPGKTAEAQGVDSARISTRLDSDYQANRQTPLYYLAAQTGGQAILNQNDVLPGLARVASDFENYYSLGYMPAHHGDGRFYPIKVKVNRKGVRVRHREGYRDKSTGTRMSDGTRAVLLHSLESNPLRIELVVGEETPREKGRYEVPIQVRIPVSSLVLLPRADFHAARVRLFIAAVDEKGEMSEVQQTPLGINIPSDTVEAAQGEFWLYSHRLLMRKGPQRVALGIRDEFGATSAFITRSLMVGG